jgi:hypothetical protein
LCSILLCSKNFIFCSKDFLFLFFWLKTVEQWSVSNRYGIRWHANIFYFVSISMFPFSNQKVVFTTKKLLSWLTYCNFLVKHYKAGGKWVHSVESTFCDLKMCFSINLNYGEDASIKLREHLGGFRELKKKENIFFLSFKTQFLFEGIKGRLD